MRVKVQAEMLSPHVVFHRIVYSLSWDTDGADMGGARWKERTQERAALKSKLRKLNPGKKADITVWQSGSCQSGQGGRQRPVSPGRLAALVQHLVTFRLATVVYRCSAPAFLTEGLVHVPAPLHF